MPVIVTGPEPATIWVTTPVTTVVQVPVAAPATISVGAVLGLPGPVGPAGPAGPAGDSLATEVPVTIAAATWVIPVPVGFGRTPGVAVYVGGELVIAETHASDTMVSVILPAPMTGSVVLT